MNITWWHYVRKIKTITLKLKLLPYLNFYDLALEKIYLSNSAIKSYMDFFNCSEKIKRLFALLMKLAYKLLHSHIPVYNKPRYRIFPCIGAGWLHCIYIIKMLLILALEFSSLIAVYYFLNICCLGAFSPFHNFKLNFTAFLQCLEPIHV